MEIVTEMVENNRRALALRFRKQFASLRVQREMHK